MFVQPFRLVPLIVLSFRRFPTSRFPYNALSSIRLHFGFFGVSTSVGSSISNMRYVDRTLLIRRPVVPKMQKAYRPCGLHRHSRSRRRLLHCCPCFLMHRFTACNLRATLRPRRQVRVHRLLSVAVVAAAAVWR